MREGTEPRGGSVRLHVTYFTDPLCCWSWGFEPQLRRLRHAYAGRIAWHTRMGGMIPDWQSFEDPLNSVHRPGQFGPLWVQAGQATGMPIEPAIWVENPPLSSWPACLAVKTAELQSPAAADLLLRRLREALMVEGRNAGEGQVLLELATETAARFPDLLHVERFRSDFRESEARKAFLDDVKEARFRGIGRFPALVLRCPGRRPKTIVGWRPYAALIEEVLTCAPDLGPERRPHSPAAYREYWRGATDREIEVGLETEPKSPDVVELGGR